MRFRSGLVCLALAFPVFALAQPQVVLYPGLEGEALLTALRADFTPTQTLGYDTARDTLFTYEQVTGGELRGVYTGFSVQLVPGLDPSSSAFAQGINTEHTWPQSRGAGAEPARSDMHILYPVKTNVNSVRGNDPFGEIPDPLTDGWYRLNQAQSNVPDVALDEWSEKDNDHPDPAFSGRFEPREDHAGNAARAVFYFRAVYPQNVTLAGAEAFFAVQKDDLVRWHYQDAVDAEEYARSAFIAARQGSENPFVLDSTLARRAFGLPSGGGGEPAAVWINELHYDNAGGDTGEGVEVAGRAGTDLAGYSLAFYNGNGNAVYDTESLVGMLPDQDSGFGTVWFPVSGVQNGSPDGVALVAPDGDVLQFLSYEGVITASGGPADGQTSQDIGVAEDGDTPVGFSLQLGGMGDAYEEFVWQEPQPATPGEPNVGQTFAAPVPVAWINELHYDNVGPDKNEGVEIAGSAGLDLTGWIIVGYDGADGLPYGTLPLGGVIDDEGAGFGARWFPAPRAMDGSPDGLALVDAEGELVQLLSYEGAGVARGGVAAGVMSQDIGVAEDETTPVGFSLQLTGTGTAYEDFTWEGPVPHSRGVLNPGQTIGGARGSLALAPPAESSPAATMLGSFPNPFRDRTTIRFSVAEVTAVRLVVYDVLGREVARLLDGVASVGTHEAVLGARGLAGGVYVWRLEAGGDVETGRLTLVR